MPTHKRMTLGQIKSFMRIDNLVNMDTRTVFSCIPYAKLNLLPQTLLCLSDGFRNKALFRSVFTGGEENQLPEGYFFLDYRTLDELVQINNVLNIQLRNLLSLLEA